MKEFIAKTSNLDIFNIPFDQLDSPEYYFSHLTTGDIVDRQSSVKIGYDDKNLYFKFKCPYEQKFRKVLKSYNTKIYRGDCAEVFLAPNGDIKNYYEFDVSPFNGLCALKIENLDFYNINVSAIQINPIFTRTEIFENCYYVHYKIPLLQVANSATKVSDIKWAFNCYRIDRYTPRKRISQALCPTNSKTHHDSRFFGKIIFK